MDRGAKGGDPAWCVGRKAHGRTTWERPGIQDLIHFNPNLLCPICVPAVVLGAVALEQTRTSAFLGHSLGRKRDFEFIICKRSVGCYGNVPVCV